MSRPPPPHPLDGLKGDYVLGTSPSGRDMFGGTISEVSDTGAFIATSVNMSSFCPWDSIWFIDERVGNAFVGDRVISLNHPYPTGEVTYVGVSGLNVRLDGFRNLDGSPNHILQSRVGDWRRILDIPDILKRHLEALKKPPQPQQPPRSRFELIEDF